MKIFSKALILLIFLLFTSQQKSFAQAYNNFYGGIVGNCSIDSLQSNLMAIEGFGVKQVGTTAITNELSWLKNKYMSYGYTDIKIDTFSYSSNFGYNLIVTKLGSVYPNRFVIIDGHYDSKTGPGTNDNGSGVSIILEVARLLKNINTEFSIKFINFSAEEVGLIGSSHYVNNVVIPQNLDIKIVFNIDEVGGVNGQVNNTIVCERDENNNPSTNNVMSANYTDTLARCMQLYSNLSTVISYAYSSDYMPFQGAGKIITGLYEDNVSPNPHTVNDVYANLDLNFVYEVAKGSIGASLYYAVATDTSTSINELVQKDFVLYPNPVSDFITIKSNSQKDISGHLKITNLLGEIVLENNSYSSTNPIDVRHFTSGIYYLEIESDDSRISQKFIVR